MANKINQIEIDSIIYDLQDKDAKAPFTGTKAEVQLAIAEGKIKEGDIVNITDDINDYPGGGGDYPSGASNIVYLTQEQYDALPDDKLTDDIEYRIMDEGFEATAVNVGYDNSKSGLSAETVQEAVDELSRRPGGGGESNIVYLTQEAYDALPESKLTDGIEYRITDANTDSTKARNISYDNAESGLEATSVQGAIDTMNESLSMNVFGERVTLTINENYVCPCDGYFKIYCTYSKSSYIKGFVNGEELMNLGSPSSDNNTTNQQMSVFVRKGMTIMFGGTYTGTYPNYGYFLPLA